MTTVKRTSEFYPGLRIKKEYPMKNPLDYDAVLNGYVSAILKRFRVSWIKLLMDNDSAPISKIYEGKLDELINGFIAYLRSVSEDTGYDVEAILGCAADLLVMRNSTAHDYTEALSKFAGSCARSLSVLIKTHINRDDGTGYVAKAPVLETYGVYRERLRLQIEETEDKPNKKRKAQAIADAQYVENIVNTILSFTQAVNFMGRLQSRDDTRVIHTRPDSAAKP